MFRVVIYYSDDTVKCSIDYDNYYEALRFARLVNELSTVHAVLMHL